ncbi:MAG: DUF2807 domain-containing protein [Saprospiraceae bacterium]|nr:DUF2807 domain-containing protein [Saprospiraceae bacterium]
MKKFVILSTLIMTSLTLTAQNWWKSERGAGPIKEKKVDVANFDGVELAFSGNVYIRQGKTQKVEVEMQESLFQYLNTRVRNGIWTIKFDRNVRTRDRVKVYITVPDLQQVYVSGSGNITVERFSRLQDLDLKVSGSGDIVMDVEANNITAAISGSGDITLEGTTQSISTRISGSGDITSHRLEAKDGSVTINGSGDDSIFATNNLDVRINGSGDVAYKGRPSLRAKTYGSGDVEAM